MRERMDIDMSVVFFWRWSFL